MCVCRYVCLSVLVGVFLNLCVYRFGWLIYLYVCMCACVRMRMRIGSVYLHAFIYICV